jgi:HTH-type transcriptional regulator / antitoxin HipB
MECMIDLIEIGGAIRAARKSKKLTQANLSKPLGMSRATISGIENGTVLEIGIRKVMSICEALGLELHVQDRTRRPTMRQLMAENREEGLKRLLKEQKEERRSGWRASPVRAEKLP